MPTDPDETVKELQTDQPSTSPLDLAYRSETLQKLSAIWWQKLHAHFQSLETRKAPVLNWIPPATAIEQARKFLDQADGQRPEDMETTFGVAIDAILAHSQNLHHPRYIGHQVPASVPVAGLFDAVASMLNQPMAVYEMSPWATAVERAVVQKMCEKVGWKSGRGGGVLTSGGSLANLTALLTARNVRLPGSWENGVPSDAVLFAHADAHYCISRAAGILGLGTAQIRRAALDSRRRMDAQQLDESIVREKAAGKLVVAVSAASCATPIGAFDPLRDIADVCRKHDVWLHVDAAHGGGALMSQTHRHLLNGISSADSVVWDCHKMMFVPALCAAVLYQNPAHQYSAFQQDAPYLFDPNHTSESEYDSGTRTMECTKRALGLGVWGLWAMFGETLFEQLVNRTFELAGYLYEAVNAATDFESMHVPECNIVVFRHLPEEIARQSVEKQNQFQQQLRTTLVRSGDFYLVQTTLDGQTALRATVMNPTTTPEDIDQLILAIRRTGLSIIGE